MTEMKKQNKRQAWLTKTPKARKKEIIRWLDRKILQYPEVIQNAVDNHTGDIMSISPKQAVKTFFPHARTCKATVYCVTESYDMGKSDTSIFSTLFMDYKDAISTFNKKKKEIQELTNEEPDEWSIDQDRNRLYEVEYNCYEKWASVQLSKVEIK